MGEIGVCALSVILFEELLFMYSHNFTTLNLSVGIAAPGSRSSQVGHLQSKLFTILPTQIWRWHGLQYSPSLGLHLSVNQCSFPVNFNILHIRDGCSFGGRVKGPVWPLKAEVGVGEGWQLHIALFSL